MLIFLITLLIFTTGLTSNRQTTIYYTRISILGLLISNHICYTNNHILCIDNGISIYGGIFNITSVTQSFQTLIIIVSSFILIYNSFYHRTIISDKTSGIRDLLMRKLGLKSICLGDYEFNIYKIMEYPVIILFAICGASFLMCSGDLISLFISLELQSYSLYILSTSHRESEQSTWGGGLSSCFILLGSAILYVNSGITSLESIYIITAISETIINSVSTFTNYFSLNKIINIFVYNTHYIDISLILISVGLLFKVSAAPFHFWSPDVYDALPTAVTTYVAIIAKISLFILLLDLVYYIDIDKFSLSWINILLISSMLSLIIGSLLGLTQFRIKRVLAYSTISHVGFILLALCVNRTESIQAYIFYIISYTISNLNVFMIIVCIGYEMYLFVMPLNDKVRSIIKQSDSLEYKNFLDKYPAHTIGSFSYNLSKGNKELVRGLNNIEDNINYTKINIKNLNPLNSLVMHNNPDTSLSLNNSTLTQYRKGIWHFDNTDLNIVRTLHNKYSQQGLLSNLKDTYNSPIQLVSQLKGFYHINSYLCLSLTITLFSFVGIPPLIGFFAKQMVLSAALDSGYVFIAIVAILTSVIAAVYYLNIVKQMFFFKPDYMFNPYLTQWQTNCNNIGIFKTYKAMATQNIQYFNIKHLCVSSPLSITISILSLVLSLFIFIPDITINIVKIMSLYLFN